ncbi:maltooligosyl trehalose hydrolase [Luteibacter rhizovicinus]|uniref:Malto-oligosyltrehalose trehalohydrolase n=1 Tax=Luteibacter rhizovicinus TaxID=242606 RepID=A0A4R3YXG5_9GAMM|nr:malto-oligosyltrehalose trehalohydrolase [Luteibacter rhizovicinus]TCV97320.1 maltooligosyl trehalose hydrolase [Luteibacter rhizovicinus]
MTTRFAHAMPYGVRPLGRGRARFRLWAPDVDTVFVETDAGAASAMHALTDGWFEGVLDAPVGTGYRFRVKDGLTVPDPASRLQKDGDVHGYSVITEPTEYAWRHGDWKGRPWREAVIYEVHAGLMGGFDGVRAALPRLAELGFTAIELMPIAEFPGERNWGYDGVLPFAPATAYGSPDDLKRLVDDAHGFGLMVFLDVVYNHFGPEGNYLGAYASPFFQDKPHTPWGPAIAVSVPQVGDYFVHNALYWVQEFRIDGLRLDAVHAIGNPGWLASLASRVRAVTGPGRHIHLVLENESNQAHLLGRERFDAQWNDDFHNALHVLITGESEGYYAHYQDPLPKLERVLTEGFAWQGEIMGGKHRGEYSADKMPARFVSFLQNHDQIGNRALGDRLTTLVDEAVLVAATALLLLAPFVPLMFMGEEWGSRTPFLFFADFGDPALRDAVREGRRKEFAAFASFSGAGMPDPAAPSTFDASRPDMVEASDPVCQRRLALVRELLALRARHIAPWIDDARSTGARTLGDHAFRASWKLGTKVLTIFANLGDVDVTLKAPPSASAAWIHGDAASIAAVSRGLLPSRHTLACVES